MREKTNYGNWVPEKALYMLFGGAAILLVAAIVSGVMGVVPVITWIAGVIGVLMLVMAVYMLICHEEFAFGKGNMMAGVHQHLVDHLDWDGKGELLDIGCGAAALTVRCAKAFLEAEITAMDYWGAEWNYAKEQCENNARLEGVANRITFQKGDAAKDKRDVVKEALRVVKKGGVFSFQDMFSQKALYGDMDEFVRELKAEGISEVHYIGNLEKKLDFIPGYVKTPWMISGMGILYGRK